MRELSLLYFGIWNRGLSGEIQTAIHREQGNRVVVPVIHYYFVHFSLMKSALALYSLACIFLLFANNIIKLSQNPHRVEISYLFFFLVTLLPSSACCAFYSVHRFMFLTFLSSFWLEVNNIIFSYICCSTLLNCHNIHTE